MNMDDLRRRFATLDSIPAPIDRSEIERRLRAAGQTPMRPVIARKRPVFQTSPGFVMLMIAGLLIVALAAAAAFVGSQLSDVRLPVVNPPAELVPDSTKSTTTAVPTAPPTGVPSADCAAVSAPAAVRVTELDLPDIDSGPLLRPAAAGCAIWIPSGDNDGGTHRIDLVTGAVSTVNPPDGTTDIDADGGQLWAIRQSEEAPALLRVDPATGAVVAEVPTRSTGSVMRIAGGRAWVGGYRSGLTAFDLSTGETVAVPVSEGTIRTIETGAGAVWAVMWTAEGTRLFRVDISTAQVTVVPIPRTFSDFAVVDDRLYIGTDLGEVAQIDPVTGAIVTSLRLDESKDVSISLVAQGSSIWALPIRMVPFGIEYRLVSTELVEIDGATGAIRGRIQYQASSPFDLWATNGSLWLYAEHPAVRFELPSQE